MTDPAAPTMLLAPLGSSAAMRAITGDRARLQRMLDFIAALARAETVVGVIPASVVDAISAACQAERYDIAALAEDMRASGNAAMAVIRAVRTEVDRSSAPAAVYVCWGANSQDVADTALVLELRAAIDALTADLNRAIEGFIVLAGRQRRTPAVARTQLQQSLPIPFGLRLAGYAAALGRSRERLRRLRKEALLLQLGGTVGTLAALGDHGLNVAERLAALLDLPTAEAPWQSHRDRLGEVAAALGILAGTCGKIGRDMALLMQTEIGEAFEPFTDGNGEAANMPHRRTPNLAGAALAAAAVAPQLVATILAAQAQEHERGLGGLQAEWATFPTLMLTAAGAAGAIADMAQGIEVDAERMRANLDITHGANMAEAIAFALAARMGSPEALTIVEEASRKAAAEKRSLQHVLNEDPRVTEHLPGPVLTRMLEPMSYQGAAQTFIDRLVGQLRTSSGKRS